MLNWGFRSLEIAFDTTAKSNVVLSQVITGEEQKPNEKELLIVLLTQKIRRIKLRKSMSYLQFFVDAGVSICNRAWLGEWGWVVTIRVADFYTKFQKTPIKTNYVDTICNISLHFGCLIHKVVFYEYCWFHRFDIKHMN